MNRFLRPSTIRYITKATMVIMWLMAFFSIGRYELELITSKQAFQSISLYMFWFVINGDIYISNAKQIRGDIVAFYNQCEHCGANLDPGEQCDCKDSCNDRKSKTCISLIEYERRVLGNYRETKISQENPYEL